MPTAALLDLDAEIDALFDLDVQVEVTDAPAQGEAMTWSITGYTCNCTHWTQCC